MAVELTRGPRGRRRLGIDRLFFDGAMGTTLQRRGLKLRQLPEELNISAPDLIASVHREFFEAGCDWATTNTFGANPFKLEAAGLSVEQVIGAATRIARAEADRAGGLVALDIGPTGRLMAPVGDAGFDDVYEAVARQVDAGAALCDAVLLETFTDLAELRIAVLAVREHCDLPIFATMSFEATGRTFFGASPETEVLTLAGLGVAALGLNCSLGPEGLTPMVEALCEFSPVPVMVQPNAGLPVMRDGRARYDVTARSFAAAMSRFAQRGVAILGGCCGTTAEHLAATIETVGRGAVPERSVRRPTAVCSATRVVEFDDFVLIGERLNPTGKKALQAALRAGDMDFVLREAVKQKEQGAAVLDVNVGLPDVDEPALLARAVTELQGAIDLPLQLDSASPAVLERAAQVYVGRPLLNSVNGKAASLEAVLPLARRYGACVLGLTLDDDGVPATAEERLVVGRRIVAAAEAAGVPRENLLLDALTLTASAQQDLVGETLRAVRLFKEELGVKTLLGVSNVSFGLPRRPLLNRTMLALALGAGLDGAIMNPGDMAMKETVAAWRVLAGRDRDATSYIDHCAAHPDEPGAGTATVAVQPSGPSIASVDAGPTDPLARAVASGLKDEAAQAAECLLADETPPQIVEDRLVPALDAVGRDYEANKIFLPQLIKAAEAAKVAFEVLRAHLAATNHRAPASRGAVALATVWGDVHDIGKNIVKVILENYGVTVHDLGKDVEPEAVVRAVKASGVTIVGLSALMTTAVASMKDTVDALRRECPAVRIIVGGAVLTPELAKFVGADFYARDAMETVRLVERLVEEENGR